MKKIFSVAMVALCFFCVQSMRANLTVTADDSHDRPAKVSQLEINNVSDPGFIGEPMLAKYGYRAYVGNFSIEVGQGMTNVENLVDADPTNYGSCAGIGATVALDHLCVVSPDKELCERENITPRRYKAGDRVGFVLSDNESAGSVLNLDLIKMFVIYLYDGKDLVKTINAKGSELDVLGLSVISYGAGMQKVSITTPDLDDNNKPLEFDGIGLGVAGVDVNAIEQVRIHYAFYDSFVEVPVIKRYFNNASAKTEGMVSGAKYLVNNNIEDGATTAVLNVGGAYYDVYAGEPLPTGIEAGFTMTAGEVLDLNLGKAVRLQAIVKDESDEYKYINLTTGFDVVGLSVAGGGKTDVSAMIPSVLVDEAGKSYDKFYGLRLERISGVDVELGATVVHYAYVKLPEFPEEEVPYLVNMYLLPGAAYTPAGTLLNASYSATQKLNDKLLIKNSAVKPLLIKDNMSQAWRSGNGGGPSGSNDYAMLSIFRIKKMKHWCLLKTVNKKLLNSVFISVTRFSGLKTLSHFSNDYIGVGASKLGFPIFHECRTIYFQPDC